MAGDPGHLRHRFLAWQCRVRQHAARQHGGRPSPGMRPRVVAADGRELSPAVTVLLIEREPAATTAEFRHVVRRTHDPERRYRDALALLQDAHFQRPERFSDTMTATFPLDSPTAAALAAAGACVLEFEQFGQSFRLPCGVADLDPADPAHAATYWHNTMFNPAMPGAVRVLAFTPDWRQATAYPPD